MMRALTLPLLLLFVACGAPQEARDEPPRPSVDTTGWPDTFPGSMKGYELYGWIQDGETWFTLVTGTNRQKTFAELADPEPRLGDNGFVRIRVRGAEAARELLRRVQGEVVVQGVEVLLTRHESLPDGVESPPAEVLAQLER
jgi:hypothetical protein